MKVISKNRVISEESRLLKSGLEEVSKKAQESLEEKDRAINELREQVKKLKIEKKEKDKLEAQIEALSKTSSITISPDTVIGFTAIRPNIITGAPSGMIGSSLLSNESGLNLAYTQKCSLCGKTISESFSLAQTYPPVCSACRSSSVILHQKCSKCGKAITDSLGLLQTSPLLCSNCRSRQGYALQVK